MSHDASSEEKAQLKYTRFEAHISKNELLPNTRNCCKERTKKKKKGKLNSPSMNHLPSQEM